MAGENMFYGADPKLFEFAMQMRLAPTEAELIAWNILKAVSFKIYRFRRQHPMGTYIADFYSHSLKLVIEIDGGYHQQKFQKEYDDFRDDDMDKWGIKTMRFRNNEVLNSAGILSDKILFFIQEAKLNNVRKGSL